MFLHINLPENFTQTYAVSMRVATFTRKTGNSQLRNITLFNKTESFAGKRCHSHENGILLTILVFIILSEFLTRNMFLNAQRNPFIKQVKFFPINLNKLKMPQRCKREHFASLWDTQRITLRQTGFTFFHFPGKLLLCKTLLLGGKYY